MKCLRCNNVEVPSSRMVYRSSPLPLTCEERKAMSDLGYCGKCWRIIQFERVKYVHRPYKVPIERKLL
jgi:hypothetical protein